MSCLQAIVDDPLMRHSAVLVFANKQDLVGPHSVSQDTQIVCCNCGMVCAELFLVIISIGSGWTGSC